MLNGVLLLVWQNYLWISEQDVFCMVQAIVSICLTQAFTLGSTFVPTVNTSKQSLAGVQVLGLPTASGLTFMHHYPTTYRFSTFRSRCYLYMSASLHYHSPPPMVINFTQFLPHEKNKTYKILKILLVFPGREDKQMKYKRGRREK